MATTQFEKGNEMTYTSASYLASLHPQQEEELELMIDRLPETDPVGIVLSLFIGAQFHVQHDACNTCGAIVHDKTKHDLTHGI